MFLNSTDSGKKVGLMVLKRKIRGIIVLNSKKGDHLDTPHCTGEGGYNNGKWLPITMESGCL